MCVRKREVRMMSRQVRRVATALIAAILVALAIPVTAKAVTTLYYGTGIGSGGQEHSYTGVFGDYSAHPIQYHMRENSKGNIEYVSYNQNDGWTCSIFSGKAPYNKISSTKLNINELPIYGGYYYLDGYRYIMTGAKNEKEKDSVEVMRLTKFDENWNRIDSVSIKGAETTIPFDFGTVSFANYKSYLVVRTSHERYTTSDGLRHQTNLTIIFDIEKMKLVDSYYIVGTPSKAAYVSHSLNQLVLIDEGRIVALDQGDAYPRAVVINKSAKVVDVPNVITNEWIQTEVLTYEGKVGENSTGVGVGDFVASKNNYLVASSYSAHGAKTGGDDPFNILLSVVSKDLGTVNNIALTHYTKKAYDLTCPYIVPLTNDRYMVMWTYCYLSNSARTSKLASLRGTYFMVIDGDGRQITDTYVVDGPETIGCKPIYIDGKVVYPGSDSTVVAIDVQKEWLTGSAKPDSESRTVNRLYKENYDLEWVYEETKEEVPEFYYENQQITQGSIIKFGHFPTAGQEVFDTNVWLAINREFSRQNLPSNFGTISVHGKHYYKFRDYKGYTHYYDDGVLEWQVLSVEGDKALIISAAAVENRPYNTYIKDELTWDKCTLRSYLNGYDGSVNVAGNDYKNLDNNFIDIAFNETEQSVILTTDVSKTAKDKIFILSYAELTDPKYGFADRLVGKNQIPYVRLYYPGADYPENSSADYLLRDLDDDKLDYFDCDYFGWKFMRGAMNKEHGVLPAMYISISAFNSLAENMQKALDEEKPFVEPEPMLMFVSAPGKTEIKSAKVSKKNVTIKWTALKEAEGYELEYASSPDFADSKTVVTSGNDKTSASIALPKSGAYCYVRVRGYLTRDKLNAYGVYTEVKKIDSKGKMETYVYPKAIKSYVEEAPEESLQDIAKKRRTADKLAEMIKSGTKNYLVTSKGEYVWTGGNGWGVYLSKSNKTELTVDVSGSKYYVFKDDGWSRSFNVYSNQVSVEGAKVAMYNAGKTPAQNEKFSPIADSKDKKAFRLQTTGGLYLQCFSDGREATLTKEASSATVFHFEEITAEQEAASKITAPDSNVYLVASSGEYVWVGDKGWDIVLNKSKKEKFRVDVADEKYFVFTSEKYGRRFNVMGEEVSTKGARVAMYGASSGFAVNEKFMPVYDKKNKDSFKLKTTGGLYLKVSTGKDATLTDESGGTLFHFSTK